MHCSRRMTHSLSAFFFYIADLIYIGRELKLLHKSDGRNAGWVKRFDHKCRGRLTFFLRTKIVYLYQVYRRTYSCFVVYKDYSYWYKCIINFLKCVCVVIFYFLHYCGNLTRWLVFWVVSFAFRMTRGWAILIVFDCVIAL